MNASASNSGTGNQSRVKVGGPEKSRFHFKWPFLAGFAAAILLIFGLVQKARSQSSDAAANARNARAHQPGSLSLNVRTWEVSGPDYSREELAALNSAERRMERAFAAEAILNPVKPGPRVGQNAAEIAKETAAAIAISNPGLMDSQRSKTIEENNKIEEARQSILNPGLPR